MTLNIDEAQQTRLYESLPPGNFIRCLILHPGVETARLECRLEIVNLNDDPSYEAISYVWGVHPRTEELQCNGLATHITPNLSEALHRFRHPSQPRTLWADSLCINQADDVEKGDQVALMGQIYAAASRVLVHIGGEDSGHAAVMKSLVLERNAKILQIVSDMVAGQDPGEFPWMETTEEEEVVRDDRWSALGYLLSREWFCRGWVVQEVALARTAVVHWCSEEVELDAIWRCLLWAKRRCPGLSRHWSRLNAAFMIHVDLYIQRRKAEIILYRGLEPRELPLPDLLDSASGSRVSDPRDRVFAFLSLAGYGRRQDRASDTASSAQMKPDYTKATGETYTKFARQQILQGDLTILDYTERCHGEAEKRVELGHVPSWVPCWNLISSSAWLNPRIRPPLQPSSSFEGVLTRDVRGTTLVMTGVVFDTMQIRSDVLLKADIELSDVASLWKTVSTLDLASAYQTVGPRPSVLLQCLHTGGYPPGTRFDKWDCEQEVFANLLLESVSADESIETLAGPEGLPEIHPFVNYWSAGRRLMSTTRGLLGLAPTAAMDGDVCAILFGCPIPFILRRVTDRADGEEPRYTMVGLAWIGGLQIGTHKGRDVLYVTGSEDSKDWVGWGLKEHEIFIV